MHRDVKPHNIMIDHSQRKLRLIDWGLAEVGCSCSSLPVFLLPAWVALDAQPTRPLRAQAAPHRLGPGRGAWLIYIMPGAAGWEVGLVAWAASSQCKVRLMDWGLAEVGLAIAVCCSNDRAAACAASWQCCKLRLNGCCVSSPTRSFTTRGGSTTCASPPATSRGPSCWWTCRQAVFSNCAG